MPELLDALDLADGRRLAIVADDGGLSALPMVCDADGQWRRAAAGDGVAEALLAALARETGVATQGAFTVASWAGRVALGERPIGVDQTNQSVIVGDAAVVKWATHLQEGPHPAPRRVAVLREAGFGGMPSPWGLVTWRSEDGVQTVAASVDEYLPGAVDGWTWAVDLITAAAGDGDVGPVADAAAQVGALVAEMHAALSVTAAPASAQDAHRWRDAAFDLLGQACSLHDFAGDRRSEIAGALESLGALAGTPVIEGHGDLHVGQVLLSGGRFFVTDFDGNPVLPAAQRILPIPAALDVAGMVQSLSHAAIVARKYTDLDPTALADVDAAGRKTFLAAYQRRLASLGPAELYDPTPLRAFRMQQVLREIIYAARHLPRWMYVPDAALPALLDEGVPS
ncbi:glucosamine kinase [Mycolicibacterium stellerae]|uniref:glucosamine kinase n=1 Tax=Mycolicibacterium stellerae TaxID=2358193 RepID=UPI000F0B9267|nr:glucosamine kinase [Mycolicibacterium stellerae]